MIDEFFFSINNEDEKEEEAVEIIAAEQFCKNHYDNQEDQLRACQELLLQYSENGY